MLDGVNARSDELAAVVHDGVRRHPGAGSLGPRLRAAMASTG
jgi:hypothetical protein